MINYGAMCAAFMGGVLCGLAAGIYACSVLVGG